MNPDVLMEVCAWLWVLLGAPCTGWVVFKIVKEI